jgi:hypothetical protein
MKYLRLANQCEHRLAENAAIMSMFILHRDRSQLQRLAHESLKLYRIRDRAMRLTKSIDKRGRNPVQ